MFTLIACTMDKKSFHTELASKLKELSERCSSMDPSRPEIPRIEIDSMLEQLRRIYDLVHAWGRMNDPGIQEIQKEEAPLPEDAAVESVKEEKGVESAAALPEEKPVVNAAGDSPPDLFSAPTESIADKYLKSERKTVADRITGGREDKSVARKMSRNKIEDIRTVIGINEKFFFINDLFQGDMKEYQAAIDRLNSYTARAEALSFLDHLKKDKNWKDDAEGYLQLRALVERRYL
jgi:hypothetical protein